MVAAIPLNHPVQNSASVVSFVPSKSSSLSSSSSANDDDGRIMMMMIEAGRFGTLRRLLMMMGDNNDYDDDSDLGRKKGRNERFSFSLCWEKKKNKLPLFLSPKQLYAAAHQHNVHS